MFSKRALLALTFGAGITALLLATVGITWIVGIMLLSPGIWLASLISNSWVSLIPMFIANALIYALPSYLLTLLLLRPGRPTARIFAMSALATISIVFLGWIGTRELEKRGAGVCGNEEVSHSVSPDGTKIVIVFVRDCGVLGDESTEALLVDRNRQLNHLDTGNVFVTDERDDVTVEWQSPTKVRLSYPQSARIMKTQPKVGGVSIEYHVR